MFAPDQRLSSGVRVGRRARSALLAAVALALGLFRGAELCFCVREASAEHGHAHCLTCDPCGVAEHSASEAEGMALAEDADACDHLVVEATDLYLDSQTDAPLRLAGHATPFDITDAVVVTHAAVVWPPSTAPPDERGDRFLSYRNRIFLRS